MNEVSTKEIDDVVFDLLEFILRSIKNYDDTKKMQIVHYLSVLLREHYIELRIKYQLAKMRRRKKIAVGVKL